MWLVDEKKRPKMMHVRIAASPADQRRGSGNRKQSGYVRLLSVTVETTKELRKNYATTPKRSCCRYYCCSRSVAL